MPKRPDYATLARQYGGAPSPRPSGQVDYAMLARRFGGEADESEPSLTERVVPAALRIGGAIAGGVAGGAVASPSVFGIPAGIIAGGAVGAGLGETAAQAYERRTGQRDEFNPTQIVVQTGLGAVPMGRAFGATVPRIAAGRALQGGVMGGGATVATELAETGELPTGRQLAVGTGLGVVLGGGLGAVEGRAVRRAVPPPVPGRVYEHPELGRVQALDVPGDGTVRVTRGGGQEFVVRAADVTPARTLPALSGDRTSYVATPDGVVASAGADIPMTAAPDGSYVRSVPAEYARREIAGMLPPGREPIITQPPPGSVPDRTDPSFARGVPGQYARREIRGELPAGPRFAADPYGNVARVEQVNELVALAARYGGSPVAPESAVRSLRPAVLERDIDVTRPTKQAITVRQFSSDPAAVDAPMISPDDTRTLRVMREDLATFAPERGRLVRDPNDPNSSIYAHGGAGSRVGDDMRVISGQRVGNDRIVQAIDDLLAGKPPTNKLHLAAIDAARGYAEGRAGYRGPQLPMDVVDEGGMAGVAARESARGGGASNPLDDFDAFSRMFDDVEPIGGGGREPGQEGFIAPMVAARLGGAVAGAVTGAATGEDTEDRIGRAVLFGTAGAMAPSLLGRGAGRSTAAPGRIPAGGTLPVTVPGAGRRGVVSVSGRSGADINHPLAGFDPLLDKFKNPLIRSGVAKVITDNGGFAQQRRGVIDTPTLGRFAEQVKVSVAKTLPKGTALNAEQITAYARALQETTRKVNELAAKVNSAAASDADIVALQAARAEQNVIAKSFTGARAEAGRALGTFNFWQGVLDSGDVQLIRDAVDGPGLRSEAQRIARELGRQPNDPLWRYKWLQQQTQPTLMDKVRSYYYANILSGVKTHERNLIGNVANVTANLAVHPFAAAIDAAVSGVRGTPRTVRFDELPSQAAGALAGLDRGFRDFVFTMREGVSPDALSRSLTAGELGKLDVPRVEFKGGAANPFNMPGRLLDATDTLFRSIARNMELYGLAHRQAKAERLTGPRFLNRVAELRAGTTPEGVALRQQAETAATRTVFQERPGALAAALQQGARAFPPLSFVLPFIKTPANILRQGLEFSPAGAAMKAVRQGGRAGTQAQARVAAGTAAAGVLAYLAGTGRLSGDGPSNSAERNALWESGWRPNSVKIGDQWVSYQLFQPVSVQAAIIANAFEAWAEGRPDENSAASIASDTVGRSISSFLSQSFLSGLFDFIEAITERDDWRWSRVAGRMASSMVPLSAAVRTVQQGTDPVVRRPQGVLETVEAGLPGRFERLEPRLTRFGEPVTREGGAVRRAVDPFNVSSEQRDTIADELDRIGSRLSLPSDDLALPGGRQLTREQEFQLRQAKGRAVRQQLERLMADRQYQYSPDNVRLALAKRVIDRTRDQVSQQARRELLLTPAAAAR